MRRFHWLIPLSAVPVLLLLAYGFRLNPRVVASPLVGRPAPGFTLRTLSAEPVSLQQFRGKVVVLNFWASWCFPCWEEAPVLERGWRNYHERGVVVLGVNIQDSPEAAQRFIARVGLTFPNVRDLDGKVPISYGVYGVPETFFIDREGRIRAKHVGAITDEAFRRFVEPLLSARSTMPGSARVFAGMPAE